MQTDFLFARKGGDLFHLFEIENLAVGAADGGFDGYRTDRNRIRRGGGAIDRFDDLRRLDGGAAGREWNQVESAQSLGAIAFVTVKMTLFLHQHMTPVAGEQADR